MGKQKKTYNAKKMKDAVLFAIFRGVAAGYLFYLSWKIAGGASHQDAMPVWAGRLIGAGLFAVGVIFAAYAWRQFLLDRRKAGETEKNDESAGDGKA